MKNGEILKFLIDTGSNKNYIQPRFIRNPIPNDRAFYANSVGGNIKITHHSLIDIFGQDSKKIKFFILPNLISFNGIIGNDTLKDLNAVIHTSNNYMTIHPGIRIPLKQYTSESVNSINLRTSHLTEELRGQLNQIIKSCPNLFSDPNMKLTYTSGVKGEIRTTTSDPVYSKSYPYPLALKNEVESQIKELLDDGIIRPSKSPYNSPIWVVPKKMDASGKKNIVL